MANTNLFWGVGEDLLSVFKDSKKIYLNWIFVGKEF